MKGKLYAIGTGPGAPDLLTVRASRLLNTMDVVIAPASKTGRDSLALSIVREFLGENTEVRERNFPMMGSLAEKEAVWQSVADECAELVKAGKTVAFISLGDVMLYSTWVTIMERLPSGIPTEIVPGITSFAFISARIQQPLVMETGSLAIIPCTTSKEDIAAALTQHSSLVLMKAGVRFPELREQIKAHGLLPHAVLVSDATLETERVCRNLMDIKDDEKLSYFSTILINKEWTSS